MAGYCDFSMSNNAKAAYWDGLVPASKIRGVPAELVRRFCEPKEWHHTSSRFNCTDFYDPEVVRSVFGLQPEDYKPDPYAVEALEEWKAAKKKAPEVFNGCTVEWLHWTRDYYNRRRPIERREEGCRVEIKGATAKITLPSGKLMTKRITSVSITGPGIETVRANKWY